LQKYPSDVAALSRLSDCYLQLGHTDSALLGYRRVLQIDPAYTPAQQRLEKLLNSADSGELSPASGSGNKVP
jgi:cytochrome c-type biogenesis protein CcmH/NrfG